MVDKEEDFGKKMFNLGYNKAKEQFNNLIDNEIENEQDAIIRKAHRNWTIINELELIKRKLKEL